MKQIAVYCSSRFDTDKKYINHFHDLADALIHRGIDLIYGGANVGYMKVLATRIAESKQRLIGVMPQFLVAKELVYEQCDEIVFVDTLPERIHKIMTMANGFIAMPGGVGTLEEVMDMMSWAQVGIHHKPIGILNVEGYFDGLLMQLERGMKDQLIAKSLASQVLFTDDVNELLDWMENKQEEEYWDIYDAHGNLTALIHPRSAPLMEDQFHKIVIVVVIDDKNNILIQKRAPHVAHPNLWDYSAGGSVMSGEDSMSAAIRETKEELGIDLTLELENLIHQFVHRQMFVDVYLVHQQVNDFDFSGSNEVVAVKWVQLDEVKKMIEMKMFKNGNLQKEILRILYEKLS